ncbi:alginate lyase family protein [Pullulanibacillus sp. KACC 23026]|uniref:alginate lyase family protein n=1 Tax=Pullulanibacillus sp. KACC 23026 TaxID=3028315 RepID=UPI0023AF1B71|nr:alginate lyase family protein [Pullulanibacillus sp. KACC 23026]WEG13297.1 alginate lyase family protein [Pullulanibacillus sp. KACC 23026]
MIKIENAFLLDIALGYPFGKVWFPSDFPEVTIEEIPNTFLLKGKQLAGIKRLVEQNDSTIARSIEGLMNRADAFLAMPPISVTQKKDLHEGTTLNDYCSLAKYWWPNLDTKNGLPYIRRDGEVNPDCYNQKYDLNRLDRFSEATLILGLAGFITEKKVYLNKAMSLIKTWLIDSDTRQTPHFRFAQIVPGRDAERATGLIEARRLIYVCESIQLLKHANAVSEQDEKALVEWFRELLTWMLESQQGQKALKQKNNIGFWVDLQCLIYANFCGERNKANKLIKDFLLPRIEDQVDVDGKLKRELTRAMPYDYAAFTLMALAGLSTSSEHNEIKLDEYSSEEGRNFQNAFKWFNAAVHNNDLQEPSLSLARFTILQQELAQLREEILQLESQLIGEQTQLNAEADLDDEVRSRLTERLERAEKENGRLRAELNNIYRSMMSAAFHYRGTDFIFEEQAKRLKELNRVRNKDKEINIKLKEELDQLQNDYFKTLKDLQSQKQENTSLQTQKEELKLELENQMLLNKELMKRITTTLSNRVERTENLLANLTKQLESKKQSNREKLKAFEQKEKNLLDLNKKIKTLTRDKDRYKRLFKEAAQSKTWRYTSPLRKVLDNVKGRS